MSAIHTSTGKDAHHLSLLWGVGGFAVASSTHCVRVQTLRRLRATDEQTLHEPSRTSREPFCRFSDVADRSSEIVERERAARRLDRGRRARDVHGGGSENDTAGLVVLGFDGVEDGVALEHDVLADAAALKDVHLRLEFRMLGA